MGHLPSNQRLFWYFVTSFDEIRVTRFLYIIANLSQAEACVHRIHDAIGCRSVLSKLVDSGPNPSFYCIFLGWGKCVMYPSASICCVRFRYGLPVGQFTSMAQTFLPPRRLLIS